jgi:hypothetical protein
MCDEHASPREMETREQTNTNTQTEKPMIETPTPQYVVSVEETDPCAGLHEEELEPVTR